MSKENEAYFKGLSDIDRLTALRENATAIYSKNVVRDFTEDELIEMKDQLSDVDIQMNDAEIEKKEMTAEVNVRIKKFKESRLNFLRDLKNKYYENNEEVFDMADQIENKMYTFDNQGNLIGERKLTPKEKQTTIVNFNKTA